MHLPSFTIASDKTIKSPHGLLLVILEQESGVIFPGYQLGHKFVLSNPLILEESDT